MPHLLQDTEIEATFADLLRQADSCFAPASLALILNDNRLVELVCEFLSIITLQSVEGTTHPNGFRKFRLSAHDRSRAELRLHVWHGERHHPSDIHEHPWHAASRVLSGRMVDRRFELADGNSHRILVNWTPSKDQVNWLAAGVVSVRETSRTTYLPNDVYLIDSFSLHRTEGSENAATLLVRSPYQRDFSLVVRPVGKESR